LEGDNMDQEFKMEILSENTVYKKKLRAEHGLSLYFEYGDKKYLFDTGQGLVLKNNAEQLNINLKDIDTVILSHGHYDHTGGLKELLQINPEIDVVANQDIFIPKYKIEKDKKKFNGIDIKQKEINNFINAKGKDKVDKGIYISQNVSVPNETKFKDKYKINKELMIDKFSDEISISIKTKKGLIILLGCSHRGVVNIIKDVKKRHDEKIIGIVGGLHLKKSSQQEVNKIINYLDSINFDLLVPIHCTGKRAALELKKHFENRVKLSSVGDVFSL